MLRNACASFNLEPRLMSVFNIFADNLRYVHRDDEAPITGDIFFWKNSAFYLHPKAKTLFVWEFRLSTEISKIDQFCILINEAISLSNNTEVSDWSALKQRPVNKRLHRNRYAQDIESKLNLASPDYEEDEVIMSSMLAIPENREFIQKISKVGKARLVDTTSDANSNITQPLLDCRILRKEYLILCKQDSHTIGTVQNREEIEADIGRKITCSCGRALHNEQIQEIFALTDAGKRLIKSSRWMSVWITDLLIKDGVDRESIYWNATAGEDEIDIIVDVFGSKIFFELKDRQFGLGDAYPFAYRVSRYGARFAVVVTPDCVADEARRFFEEQRPSIGVKIETIEGYPSIEKELPLLFHRYTRNGIFALLSELEDPLRDVISPAIASWMNSQSNIRRKSDEIAEPEPELQY